jgi:hypothetical protein
MSFQYSPYAIPLFLAAAMTIVLARYALRRRQQPEALTLGILAMALSWWSLFYALNISGADLATQHLFNRLKYIGVMVVPPLWLVLALQYTQHQSVLTRRYLILFFLPAALLLPIVLTDHLTHFWWTKIWKGDFNGQPVLRSEHAVPFPSPSHSRSNTPVVPNSRSEHLTYSMKQGKCREKSACPLQ